MMNSTWFSKLNMLFRHMTHPIDSMGKTETIYHMLWKIIFSTEFYTLLPLSATDNIPQNC